MLIGSGWSKTWTFIDGDWHEGNIGIMGPRTHAAWLCSLVFDGARAFEGVTPDLDLHCARVNESATKLYLKPTVSTETWIGLAREGVRKFDGDVALYIRPMYWAENEGPWVQAHVPESTRWCLCIYEAPMRQPRGFSVTMSPFRRPTLDSMPVDAKAGCLYPNNARTLFEAQSRGFDNAIVCDALGNVAELATSNIFMAKDGVVFTPVANGTFLAGITRQRVINLLRSAGIEVVEKTLTYRDFEHADEIFSSGNYSKVVPVTRIGERSLPFGPLYTKARELYWDFAHSTSTKHETVGA
ncbi:MAG TPA: branched-chain amino acid aminotransferase [Terriglobales bacterium]|nr:branched-chain amino acid aminotransferase [Terriglobales bacterium]